MKIRRITLCALFAALLAVFSPLTIPAGPIPVTLAVFFVFLTGLLLGPVDGMIAVAVYVALGALGLPVFSGFQGGYSVLLGPTGGFLLGYFPCVFLSGLGKTRRRFRPVFLLFGLFSCYLFGVVWFGVFFGGGLSYILSVCVLPFLLPDSLKLIAACLFAPPIESALSRIRSDKKS